MTESIEQYCRLIWPMRRAANACGYVLAVHGSLRRDIDIVAVPWTSKAKSAETLARAVCDAANKAILLAKFPDETFPRRRAHGRRNWIIVLGGGSYIDLAVTPRRQDFYRPKGNA